MAINVHSAAPRSRRARAPRLAGELITPEHARLRRRARRVWNGMIDKRPAAIARCADADDVAARDPLRRRARAAAGGPRRRPQRGRHRRRRRRHRDRPLARCAPCASTPRGAPCTCRAAPPGPTSTRVTAPLGLATPGGVVSETGVAGLALSGGVSPQRRLHGMTVDNLVSAEVVLADGRRVRASADEHPDLYWALRGGGGNFGVVTSFELRLHELGPEVFALNVAYPIEDAAARAGRLARRRRRTRRTSCRPRGVRSGRCPSIDELPEQLRGAALRRRRRHVGRRPGGGRARHAPPARARDAAARHERRRSPTSTSSARSTRSSRRACATTGRRSTSTGSPTPRSSDGRLVARAARRTTRWSIDPPLRRRDRRASAPRRPRSATAARSGC